EGAGHLGQSLYLREVRGSETGAPPPVDLVLEKRNGDFVRALIADGLVTACNDLSDGGLAVAATEMALASNIGVGLGYQGEANDAGFLFGEDQARYLIAFSPDKLTTIDQRAAAAGVHYLVVGEAGGKDMSYLGAGGARERVALDELRRLNESWL